jgi:plasmid stabilization system protein ParE
LSRRKLRFSKRAVQDIEHVLAYTLKRFGEVKHHQYKELIRQALADIAADPKQAPAKSRPELRKDARTFHIARLGKHARFFFSTAFPAESSSTSVAYSTTQWNYKST